jgi:hypothetical protein
MSASIYDLFASNESEAEDGKWFPFSDKIEIKIRRFDSKASRKVHEALRAPYQRTLKFGGVIPPEVEDELGLQHVAKGIIADWKGFTDREGNEVPFSVAAAEKILRELPDLKNAIAGISVDVKNYREEIKKDILGN